MKKKKKKYKREKERERERKKNTNGIQNEFTVIRRHFCAGAIHI
jgi:hypothetical protein